MDDHQERELRAEFEAWYAAQPMPQLLARMDPQQAAYNAFAAGRRSSPSTQRQGEALTVKTKMQWERDWMGNVFVKATISADDVAGLWKDPVARAILAEPEQSASDVCLLMESAFHRAAHPADAPEGGKHA